MAPNTVVSLLLVLQVLLAGQIHSSHGKSLRTISVEEYHNLEKSTSGSFVVVYFDSSETRREYPHFLKEFRKAVNVLDAYGIELLKVDCKGLSLNECSETSLYTYKNGAFEGVLGLDVVFNQDSLASNILQLMLKEEIEFVSIKERVQEIINAAQHFKRSVVFCYVKGYGNTEHAIFTKLVFVFADKKTYDFVITTNKKLIPEIEGLSKKGGGSIAVHVCKDGPCKVYKPVKMTTINAAQLLQLLQLPKYEHLSDKGTTSYDKLLVSVNKAYFFTDGSDITDEDGLKSLTDDYYGHVGFILVDVKKHKDKLWKFGLHESNTFPTAAFVPASPGKPQSYVELFPDQNIIFTFDNFKYLLGEYLESPQRQYKNDVMMSSLKTITFDDFKKIKSPADSFMVTKSYLMVAFCEKGSARSECRDFSKYFRRTVRTFDRRPEPEVAFLYVILSGGGDNEIGTSKRPYIRFYSKNTGDKFIVYQGTPDHQSMVDFLEKQTKLSITRLQPSNSDDLPITIDEKMDEQKESERKEHGENEAENKDEETGEETGDTEPPPPPEETEDDEVAGSVWRTELPTVPEDKVPSLTDKTFQPTRDENDLLVVNFFQPWDARSQALIGPYVEAAHSLGTIDVGKFSIRLARVNCFDWTDVCQKNNITTYPTIKLYRKGLNEFIYKGPLDSDNLVKTVLMLKTDSPLRLEAQNEVESFLTGRLPMNAAKTSYVSVLGVLPSDDGKDMKAFTTAAEHLRGSFIFGFVAGKDAMTMSTTYGVKSPGILLIKRNDAVRPRSVFDGEFTAANIMDFVRLNSLQSFGELTPMNLPLYHSHGRPLLIAFRSTAVEDGTYAPIIEKLAKDDSLRHNIFFTWMSLTSNDVNEVILKSYTGNSDVPVLIIVNHKKGLIFQYKNKVTLNSISSWIKRCLNGEEKPSSQLKKGKWEPLLEGYDYLMLMEEEEKRKKNKKSEDEDDFSEDNQEQTGAPIEKTRQRKPEDFREEDEKRHDEL